MHVIAHNENNVAMNLKEGKGGIWKEEKEGINDINKYKM